MLIYWFVDFSLAIITGILVFIFPVLPIPTSLFYGALSFASVLNQAAFFFPLDAFFICIGVVIGMYIISAIFFMIDYIISFIPGVR